MTQFPLWDRVLTDDNMGLLYWLDVDKPFYTTMSQLNIVNDDKYIAAKLIGDGFDYLGFVDGVKSL